MSPALAGRAPTHCATRDVLNPTTSAVMVFPAFLIISYTKVIACSACPPNCLCTCTTWFYSPLHLPQPPTTFRGHLSTQAVITSPPLDLPSQLCNLIPRAPLPATTDSLSPPPCPSHSTSLHCFYALKCYMRELWAPGLTWSKPFQPDSIEQSFINVDS